MSQPGDSHTHEHIHVCTDRYTDWKHNAIGSTQDGQQRHNSKHTWRIRVMHHKLDNTVNAKYTQRPVHANNLLITNRYFVSVVKQHFHSSWTVELHQHYNTITDWCKQIVLVNQIKHIAVSKSARLHDNKLTILHSECSSLANQDKNYNTKLVRSLPQCRISRG